MVALPLLSPGQPVIDQRVALLVLFARGGQSLRALLAAHLQGAWHAFPNAIKAETRVGVPVQQPGVVGLGQVQQGVMRQGEVGHVHAPSPAGEGGASAVGGCS